MKKVRGGWPSSSRARLKDSLESGLAAWMAGQDTHRLSLLSFPPGCSFQAKVSSATL
jgi:hypothetical protein